MFATLSTLPETLPAGNSATLCINLKWNTLENKAVTDKYSQIDGMPTCEDGNPGIQVHIFHEDSFISDHYNC